MTEEVTQPIRVKVAAKINLALRVGGVRSDGYHPLSTVFQAVSLFDEITAEPASAGEFRVTVSGPQAHLVPTDESNLALRAARFAAEHHPNPGELGVALHIAKAIPVAGGMAGGSADAAGALVACAALWEVDLGTDELLELGASLGADVPFCLLGQTALGTNRGDRLTPVLTRGSYHWVVALVDGELSTPAVFAKFDELNPNAAAPTQPEELLAALASGNVTELGRLLENDLQEAAFALRPGLRKLLDEGRDAGARGALLSGSGPTCFFLADDPEHATRIAVALSASGLCRDVKLATGPAPGARLL